MSKLLRRRALPRVQRRRAFSRKSKVRGDAKLLGRYKSDEEEKKGRRNGEASFTCKSQMAELKQW